MAAQTESPAKSEIAKEKPRDEDGHFVHIDPKSAKKSKKHMSPIDRFFSEHTTYSKKEGDLLNIRVGNPLQKITELLQDIKKQKAFAFTLKGSLGVMGVFLTLSVFGIFGGGQLLCDKGEQTEVGTLRVLNTFDSDSKEIPILSRFLDYVSPKAIHNRVILIAADKSTLRIPHTSKVDFIEYNNKPVIITGEYNACSRTLKIAEAAAVEVLKLNIPFCRY